MRYTGPLPLQSSQLPLLILTVRGSSTPLQSSQLPLLILTVRGSSTPLQSSQLPLLILNLRGSSPPLQSSQLSLLILMRHSPHTPKNIQSTACKHACPDIFRGAWLKANAQKKLLSTFPVREMGQKLRITSAVPPRLVIR